MTAKERARQIVRDRFPPSVTQVLYDAIEAAILEEREACAKIADSLFGPIDSAAWRAGHQIRDAICKRGQ